MIKYNEPKVNSLRYFRVGILEKTVPGNLLLYAVSGSFTLANMLLISIS